MVGFRQPPEGRKAVNLAAFRPCQEKSNSNPVGTSLCHAPRTVAKCSSPRATTQESVGERAIPDTLLAATPDTLAQREASETCQIAIAWIAKIVPAWRKKGRSSRICRLS